MKALSIDPGKRVLAWAAWLGGFRDEGHQDVGGLRCKVESLRMVLVACGLARAPEGPGYSLGALAMCLSGQVPGGADLAVVERMVHGYKRAGLPKDKVAGDLLDITAIGAYVAGTSAASVEWVTAHTWKGEVPKSVTLGRVRAALEPEELEIFQASFLSIPKTLRHNLVDGVGIGLSYFRRSAR